MNWQWWSFASILAIPSLTLGTDISFQDPIEMVCGSALIAQGSIAAFDSDFVFSVDTLYKGPQNGKGHYFLVGQEFFDSRAPWKLTKADLTSRTNETVIVFGTINGKQVELVDQMGIWPQRPCEGTVMDVTTLSRAQTCVKRVFDLQQAEKQGSAAFFSKILMLSKDCDSRWICAAYLASRLNSPSPPAFDMYPVIAEFTVESFAWDKWDSSFVKYMLRLEPMMPQLIGLVFLERVIQEDVVFKKEADSLRRNVLMAYGLSIPNGEKVSTEELNKQLNLFRAIDGRKCLTFFDSDDTNIRMGAVKVMRALFSFNSPMSPEQFQKSFWTERVNDLLTQP